MNPSTFHAIFGNKARTTGKFAFEYKHLSGGSNTSRAGIGTAARYQGPPGVGGGTYAFTNHGRKFAGNVETTVAGAPITEAGEHLLFMVDLNAGTIRVRGTGDSVSKEIFTGLAFPDTGMLPGFAITGTGTQIEFNFKGPFSVPLDAGYLPWESTVNQAPTLSLSSPGTVFVAGTAVELSGTALDPEQGDISSSIVWSSSLSGALGTGAAITPVLSVGNHTLTAQVTDGLNASITRTLTLNVTAIPNAKPQVSIAPLPGQVSTGIPLTLSASALDAESGNLSSTIQWSSDQSGALGSGASLSVTLSSGMHVLTASSTDPQGATGLARITLLVGEPTSIASYSHNALGQRVIKTDAVSDSTTHFIYDPTGKLIAEIDAATGDTLREYIYVNGQQVAVVDDTSTANEELYFVHNDHLGTPQKITNENQNVVWAAAYEPFGKATVTTSTIDNNIRFPGQYADEESGLHYNYFRDYDPSTGRYVQSDPIGLNGGNNTYAYVQGMPITHIDRLGLEGVGVWTYAPGPQRDAYQTGKGRGWSKCEEDAINDFLSDFIPGAGFVKAFNEGWNSLDAVTNEFDAIGVGTEQLGRRQENMAKERLREINKLNRNHKEAKRLVTRVEGVKGIGNAVKGIGRGLGAIGFLVNALDLRDRLKECECQQ